jgi:shikimate dehydrogenase
MHNAALRALQLDAVYLPFHVRPDRLGEAIAGIRALDLLGLNVTVPHKQAVMEHLDEIASEATAIGAVNTIAFTDGMLKGHNTDAFGILENLRAEGGLETLPSSVVLLGAGGAGRAILYALLQQTEVREILLLNRTVAKAEALTRDLDPAGDRVTVGSLGEDHDEQIRASGLLINSTAAGMFPQAEVSPLADGRGLHRDMLVVDIVYKPQRTVLMEQAGKEGARALNGLGMLAHQGARSFAIWTGQTPPVDSMMEAALAFIQG